MAYSFIAIPKNAPDWKQLHSDVFNPKGAIEMFPIDENNGSFSLGISIPTSKLDAHSNTWEELEKIIRVLQSKYSFKVFDLYGGFYIDGENLKEVRNQLIGK